MFKFIFNRATEPLGLPIDYEGVQRIEQFMFHKDAFREILLNAIVHKDYSSCNHMVDE